MRAPLERIALHPWLFWLVAVVLVLCKQALVADLSLIVNFSPHDDTLYAERAFELLSGHGFGAYDSRVLVKYPGLSLWLAGARSLGLPFLLTVNAVYFAAGAYLATALLRCGCNPMLVLISLAAYVFNPLTFGAEWHRVLREPLGTGILVAMVAAMMHLMAAAMRGERTWRHVAVLGLAFAFSLYLREDDRLLWGLLVLYAAMLGYVMRGSKRVGGGATLRTVAVVLLVPAALAFAYLAALHAFAERYYGLPIIHEFSEGEYPRLLAAIRSIDSAKDNRMVMVTQEALAALSKEVPRFAPVAARLPPPGPATLSCRLHGVCSEWSNGWMPFWIRDEVAHAGLAPTLPAAQAYYREIRLAIETACAAGRLSCTRKGDGLVPPMELRWVRAYFSESWRLALMALSPEPNVLDGPRQRFDVPLEIGRMVQAVTMTANFDTQVQADLRVSPPATAYVNPWAAFRIGISKTWRAVATLLILLALAALWVQIWRLARSGAATPGPLVSVTMVFGLFSLARFAALSYVAVFMGGFDPRMMFSAYTVGVFLALPFVVETLFAGQENG